MPLLPAAAALGGKTKLADEYSLTDITARFPYQCMQVGSHKEPAGQAPGEAPQVSSGKENGPSSAPGVEGQLNARERELLVRAIREARTPPKIALEVGTWLGGGSTLHILRALEQNGQGHLWGIEADRSIYDRMIANLKAGAPETLHRFTPLFGFSQDVIPRWIAEQPPRLRVDFVFLDGGNRPLEQVTEFQLLDPCIPVGGQLMAHDAKLRKGKWFAPYLACLDHWKTEIHNISDEGLLYSQKISAAPSPASLKAAQRQLRKARWQPTEIAAVVLPHPLRTFILKLLPRKLSTQLSDGRKLAE